jgi:hypothetical protein
LNNTVLINVGRLKTIRIPASLEFMGNACFRRCYSLVTVTFEPIRGLTRIEWIAFAACPRLTSICIPASVEIMCKACFAECESLADLTFESNSKLTQINERAFHHCSSLESVLIPPSVDMIDGSASSANVFRVLEFENGNRQFRVIDDFVVDIHRISIIRYFGSTRHLKIGRSIECLGPSSFDECLSL